ncbi:MAG: hypothetical protein AAFY02_20075 [Pseudomonadota bacterium]
MTRNRHRSKRSFRVPCTIQVEHTYENLHAHLDLEGDIALEPGDKVLVDGAPVKVAFGEKSVFHRQATVTKAGLLGRVWTRLMAKLEITELYEVSFTPARRL